MSFSWNGIHQHLLRASSSLSFQDRFDQLRRRHASLSRFADPVALLDALHHGSHTSQHKNVVLKALVEVAQSDSVVADTGRTMMLLALWPGLDAMRHRSLARRIGGPEQVASDILGRAIEAINGLDLERVNRIAATILMNIERDLGRDHAREARQQSLRADVDVDEITGSSREPPIPDGLLHRDVARAIGGDAHLVLRVAVHGFSQVEVAAEFGLSEAAARKRYQRAICRLRQDYAPSVSRSGSPTGFSGAGAMAPPPETDGAGQMSCTDDPDDLTRMPGLFRRWELSEVLKTRRTYRLEEAGADADGTPFLAIYTGAPQPTDRSAAADDRISNEEAD